LDGMSFKEIATVTKQPEGTVKSTVFRARKKLRELLRLYWRNDE
jgi:DNA-directed RNA polymerase specialized sigma24 family protein